MRSGEKSNRSARASLKMTQIILFKYEFLYEKREKRDGSYICKFLYRMWDGKIDLMGRNWSKGVSLM